MFLLEATQLMLYSDRIYKIAALFDPDGPRRRKAENGRKTGKMRKAQREALADQETMQTAVNMLQQPQMPLPAYPPPPTQMPLHYGI